MTGHCEGISIFRNERRYIKCTVPRKGGRWRYTGPDRTFSENRLERATLRTEQLEHFVSNRREKLVTEKEGEFHHRRHKHNPWKRKKLRQTCRLLGPNSLKEGAVWNEDPLLGNDRGISNCTRAVANRSANNGHC